MTMLLENSVCFMGFGQEPKRSCLHGEERLARFTSKLENDTYHTYVALMWHDIECYVIFIFLTILCHVYLSYKNPRVVLVELFHLYVGI
jgi:hypothetical protein